ncbi:MAG: hypothetical protein AMS27_13555 [Bacteroides sp. SM23_62_1]|nr:MAG: hypothetical protein AMS27_13555 [Bacteroides sp. SM23_62_1]
MYHIRLYIIVFILTGLFACSGNSGNTIQKQETRIKFDNNVYDFGTIDFGGEGICEFVFTNTGQVPLVLTNVKSSCGCTIPEWPHEPVKPGEKGKIRVSYDTYRIGVFSKSVTVYSNATNSPSSLYIKGTVKPPEQAPS